MASLRFFTSPATRRCAWEKRIYTKYTRFIGALRASTIIAKTEERSPVTLLSVLYGVMRHRLDVQAYAAPEATSLAGACDCRDRRR